MNYEYLIDTHTHIDADEFVDDFADTVKRAHEAGIGKIVIPAIEPSRFDRLQELTSNFPNVYQGIGIHPHSADKWTAEIGEQIKESTRRKKVIAIGEIGLEYFYDFVSKQVQQEVFEWHLNLAADTNLPALIHSRDAERRCIETFANIKAEKADLTGVLHCFSEDRVIMEEAIEAGLMISFTGNITFKKFANLESVEAVPLDKFMVETDAPYMAPVPNRGKRNEPSYVPNVAKKIAEVKNLSLQEIIHHSTKNAMNFFRLSLFILSFSLFSVASQAQDRYDGYEDDPAEDIDAHNKSFGIGLIVGSNTIIDKLAYTTSDGNSGISSRSYDGLLALGGSVNYFISDHFMIEGSYTYSKNQEIADVNPGISPYTYSLLVGQLYYIFNPDNAIQFFISAGAGAVLTSETYSVLIDDQGDSDPTNDLVEPQTFEFNEALLGGSFGFGYDLEMDSHIVNFSAAFNLFTQVSDLEGSFLVPNAKGSLETVNNVPFSRFFSIPRFTITYYPPLNW